MHGKTYRSAIPVKIRWRLRTLLGTLLALGCWWMACLTLANPAAPLQAPELWVHVRDGRLSVEAEAAAWGQVLHEVHRQTGIRLHLQRPLAGTVTVSIHDLPVEQALRRLFGPDASVSFLYPTADHGSTAPALPSEVWVFGKALRHAVDVPAAEAERSASASVDIDAPHEAAPEGRLTALETSAEQGDVEALQQGLRDSDQTVQIKTFELLMARDGPGTIAFLTHMAQSDDPATRTPALFLLYDTGLADLAVPLESVLAGDRQVILSEPSP